MDGEIELNKVHGTWQESPDSLLRLLGVIACLVSIPLLISALHFSFRELSLHMKSFLGFKIGQRYRFGWNTTSPWLTVIVLWTGMWQKAAPRVFPQNFHHEVLSFHSMGLKVRYKFGAVFITLLV